jgi:hypothetical protein
MVDLTPTSYLRRLPGSPEVRRPRRRELVVIEPVAEVAASRPPDVVADSSAATFDALLDTAVGAFTGHDPLDVAVVLAMLCGDSRQDDATMIGSLPASELGWTLLAAGVPAGPARNADVTESVAAVYDDLKAAAFLGEPSSRTPQFSRLRSPHEEFFSLSRLVRNVRFDDQERETLRGLWGARDGLDRCRTMTGLGIEQLLGLVDGIVTDQRARAAALPPRRFGRALAFTAEELAATVDLPAPVVTHALAYLATGLGTRSRPTVHDDTLEIRLAPILRDGERYLLLEPDLLLRALLPRLELILAERSQRERESYQRRRARWVEDTATGTLRAFLRPELCLSGVVHARGEIDGLLGFDDTIVLVEAKAKTLRALRRLDDAKRYERDVKELIVEASDSLRRSRRALRRGESLRDRDGHPLVIPVTPSTRIISVIVTLEQFWPLSAQLWRLRASGGLSAREPLPWMLTLAHLETICELLEWPAQLVDFLNRRLDLDPRVHGSDELDFIMAYLRWGLDFERLLRDDVGTVLLPTGNDEINEWVFSARGWWSRRTPRPQLEMSPAIQLEARARLRELDVSRPAGWVGNSLSVLDWAHASSPRTPRRR